MLDGRKCLNAACARGESGWGSRDLWVLRLWLEVWTRPGPGPLRLGPVHAESGLLGPGLWAICDCKGERVRCMSLSAELGPSRILPTYMYMIIWTFMNVYAHGTYKYVNSWMYQSFVACTRYIHVDGCICLYVHITDTSVHHQKHTSLSIRPDRPCYACESQLCIGSSPADLHHSCHLSPYTYIAYALSYLVYTCTCTLNPVCLWTNIVCTMNLHSIYTVKQCIYLYCSWMRLNVCCYHHTLLCIHSTYLSELPL